MSDATRTRRGLASAVLAAGLVAGASLPAAAAADTRGMWVWQGPDASAVTFALDHGVDDLYVSAPPRFSADPAYADLVAQARAAGLRVHALAGDPTWADANAAHMLAWVDEVVASGLFDGIQLDVEPYLLSDWSNPKRQRRLIDAFVRNLGAATDRAGAMPLVAAVPFWYDDASLTERRRGSLLERVLDVTDGIAVMAYRDRADGPNGITALSATEVAAATARGKTAVIGVQTAPDELDLLTFHEEGSAAMEAALAEVVAAFGGQPGFGGVAVHHHTAWRDLRP